MDSGNLTRAEVALMLFKMGAFVSISYMTLKYVMDFLDSTVQQRKKSAERARAILSQLGISNLQTSLNEHEMVVVSQLIDPKTIPISWADIGGLDAVIEDIKSDIILPMKLPSLLGSSPRPPTGVLLHGPPGCGKTMLAKATAREAGARFINLEAGMLMDKWFGETQKLSKAVFTLAVKIQPCIIFIDEIDSFLRSRDSTDHEVTAMVKAQFMNLWDGLETDPNCQVVIMGATNRPRDVDQAILRRMPAMYQIGLPNQSKRRAILKAMVDESCLDPTVDLDEISKMTEDFSGSDLREMYRAASMFRVKEFVRRHPELMGSVQFSQSSPSSTSSSSENFSLLNESDSQLRNIDMSDFVNAIKKLKTSNAGIGFGQEFISVD